MISNVIGRFFRSHRLFWVSSITKCSKLHWLAQLWQHRKHDVAKSDKFKIYSYSPMKEHLYWGYVWSESVLSQAVLFDLIQSDSDYKSADLRVKSAMRQAPGRMSTLDYSIYRFIIPFFVQRCLSEWDLAINIHVLQFFNSRYELE